MAGATPPASKAVPGAAGAGSAVHAPDATVPAPATTAPLSKATSAAAPAASPAESAASPAEPTASSPAVVDPSCRAGGLRITVDVQPSATSGPALVRAVLAATSTASSDCTVAGFARLAASLARVLGTIDLDLPTAPATVVLGSGDSAFAGMAWLAGPACSSLADLLVEVAVPRATLGGSDSVATADWRPATIVDPGTSDPRLSACGTIEIGPFEPTATGANALPVIGSATAGG